MLDAPLQSYVKGSYEINAAHTPLSRLVSTHDTSLKKEYHTITVIILASLIK